LIGPAGMVKIAVPPRRSRMNSQVRGVSSNRQLLKTPFSPSASVRLLEADFTHAALYDELAARTGVRVDGGREHIRGVVPTAAEQRVLGTPPSTGALLTSRLGFAAGRPVEWRRTLVRGDRFSLLAEFSARTGYRLAPDDRYPVPGTPTGLALREAG